MKDIAYHQYTRPTSIQAQAMPIALSGRDLLGCTETGSGKTVTFTIPMIQCGDGSLALVLAPTRELVQQIEKEVFFNIEFLLSCFCLDFSDLEKPQGEFDGKACAAIEQSSLISLYDTMFLQLDVTSSQLLVNDGFFRDAGFRKQLSNTVHSLLDLRVILIFNENDAVSTRKTPYEVGNQNDFGFNLVLDESACAGSNSKYKLASQKINCLEVAFGDTKNAGYGIGSLLVDAVAGWRYMYGVSSPLAVIMGIKMCWLPTSPRWLLLCAI
ncbi:hypothetical protein HN51_001538 [Arachis hypogaea]